jgi:hypothetical protein
LRTLQWDLLDKESKLSHNNKRWSSELVVVKNYLGKVMAIRAQMQEVASTRELQDFRRMIREATIFLWYQGVQPNQEETETPSSVELKMVEGKLWFRAMQHHSEPDGKWSTQTLHHKCRIGWSESCQHKKNITLL